MSDKFRETLKGTDSEVTNTSKEEIVVTEDVAENKHKILTTVEELEAYAIIKSILRNNIDLSHITYKDTESYFGILFDNNTRKWICRLYINVKILTLPNEDKTHTKYELNSLDDLYSYSDKLIEVLNRYIN